MCGSFRVWCLSKGAGAPSWGPGARRRACTTLLEGDVNPEGARRAFTRPWRAPAACTCRPTNRKPPSSSSESTSPPTSTTDVHCPLARSHTRTLPSAEPLYSCARARPRRPQRQGCPQGTKVSFRPRGCGRCRLRRRRAAARGVAWPASGCPTSGCCCLLTLRRSDCPQARPTQRVSEPSKPQRSSHWQAVCTGAAVRPPGASIGGGALGAAGARGRAPASCRGPPRAL